MPDHDPFLNALAERPRDDTLRLVYADWLDENGLPDHAAFLRLEVRLRRAERSPGWFGLCRAFLRAANATPDGWRELVSRPRLVGTTWRYTPREDEEESGFEAIAFEDLVFDAAGNLVYRTTWIEAAATESSGRWRQLGPRVELVINDYSTHRGTVRGHTILLRRWSPDHPTSKYGRWTVTRVPGPDCIPDLG